MPRCIRIPRKLECQTVCASQRQRSYLSPETWCGRRGTIAPEFHACSPFPQLDMVEDGLKIWLYQLRPIVRKHTVVYSRGVHIYKSSKHNRSIRILDCKIMRFAGKNDLQVERNSVAQFASKFCQHCQYKQNIDCLIDNAAQHLNTKDRRRFLHS